MIMLLLGLHISVWALSQAQARPTTLLKRAMGMRLHGKTPTPVTTGYPGFQLGATSRANCNTNGPNQQPVLNSEAHNLVISNESLSSKESCWLYEDHEGTKNGPYSFFLN